MMWRLQVNGENSWDVTDVRQYKESDRVPISEEGIATFDSRPYSSKRLITGAE